MFYEETSTLKREMYRGEYFSSRLGGDFPQYFQEWVALLDQGTYICLGGSNNNVNKGSAGRSEVSAWHPPQSSAGHVTRKLACLSSPGTVVAY